ncbi:MAG: site-specific integrase [Alphaproteobacteria bacterium]|nr:site-specific integrase [Alphaproteobacteria bacterium]
MAQHRTNPKIDSRTARADLAPRAKPYFFELEPELHLGYRRGKRGGVWVVRRYVGGGKYEIQKIGRADDDGDAVSPDVLSYAAAQIEARRVAARMMGLEPDEKPSRGPYTVAQACANYMIEHANKHNRAPGETQNIIDDAILPQLGNIDVRRLTRERLEKWHSDIAAAPARTRGLKKKAVPMACNSDIDGAEIKRRRQNTANRKLGALRAILNFACDKFPDIDDRAWRSVKPFKKVTRSRTRFLSEDEAARLVNACQGGLRDLVRAALYTGARYGELAALKVHDHHRDTDGGTLYIADSKSGEDRHIFFNNEAAQMFDRLAAGQKPNAPLLRKSDGNSWGRNHHAHHFKAALERAGIESTFTFHGLRHSFASRAIMEGASLMVVAEQLGHKDTRMVEKHYGHLSKRHVRETIQRTSWTFGVDDSDVVPIGAGR